MLSENDLRLVEALQVSPRAPWSSVGDALGVGPVTAARRWQALVARGDAWLTAYPGGELRSQVALAFVEIDCAPGQPLRVAGALAADPHVASICFVAGRCDLLAHVVAPSLREVSDHVVHRLSVLPGVVATRTVASPRLFSEGSRWRVRAISQHQRDVLTARPSRTPATTSFGALDKEMMLALGEDGRASVASLAARLGVGASTARRRLVALLASGALVLRCEIARSLSPAPVTAYLWLRVPPDELESTAQTLAQLPEVRMCAAITGAANVLLAVWLPAEHHIVALESGLATRLPRIEIVDRAITMRSVKLMGMLLDDAGRAGGRVPLNFWAPIPAAVPGTRATLTHTVRG